MNYVSLVNLKPGATGKVANITAGMSATRKLSEMGFYTGAAVRVVKNDGGPILVSLAGNKIALGRGLADKILICK